MKKLFSLIELIVVISILGILSAIIIPNISDFKHTATITAVKSDLRQLQTALDTYSLDHDGSFPSDIQPTKYVPQPINFQLLKNEYLRSLPKEQGYYYWVDFTGQVWSSTIDAPTEVTADASTGFLSWKPVTGAKGYEVFQIDGSSKTTSALSNTVKLISIKTTTDTMFQGLPNTDYVVSAIDEEEFHTPPSGYGYTGYVIQTPEESVPPLPPNNSGITMNTNSTIAMNIPQSQLITDNFTYEIWANPKATQENDAQSNTGSAGMTGQRYLITPYHGESTGKAGVGVSVGTNGISVYEHATAYMPPLLVQPLTINKPTHIAVVVKNGTPSLYVNGRFIKEGLTGTKTALASLSLGFPAYGSFIGDADEFRVWNYARTEQEIYRDMSKELTGNENGLALYWKMDEKGDTDNVIHDSTLQKRNGAINNVSWTTGLIQKIPNQPPVPVIKVPSGMIMTTTKFQLDSSSSYDPDYDKIENVEWKIDNNLVSDPSNTIISVSGIHNIQLRLKDSKGLWSDWISQTIEVFDKAALNFNGVDDVVNLSNLPTISNSFTYEFWANPTVTHEIDAQNNTSTGGISGQRYAIGSTFGSNGTAGVGVSVGTNGVSVYEHTVNYMPAVLVYSGAISGPIHISVVYNNKVPSLYLNGTLVKTGVAGSKIPVISNTIGSGAYGSFKGSLDDVRIYNYARSASEIQSDYDKTLQGNENGLIAYYKFDEGVGTTVQDSTGNNRTGTLQNGPVWIKPVLTK